LQILTDLDGYSCDDSNSESAVSSDGESKTVLVGKEYMLEKHILLMPRKDRLCFSNSNNKSGDGVSSINVNTVFSRIPRALFFPQKTKNSSRGRINLKSRCWPNIRHS
jgi:hypothetical protein